MYTCAQKGFNVEYTKISLDTKESQRTTKRATLWSRRPERTGNVSYNIKQNKKSSVMLKNNVMSDCFGYGNIKLK